MKFINMIITMGLLAIIGLLGYGVYSLITIDFSPDTADVNINIEQILEGTSEEKLSTCTLDFSKNLVCQDEEFIGTLKDGSNTDCHIFVNDGTGWKLVYQGKTSATGTWSEAKTVNPIGVYDFRAICDMNKDGMLSLGDCLTNQERLEVISCAGGEYSNGDVVGGAIGQDVSVGDGISVAIDLSDLPPTGEGNCKLQALIQTDWDYVDSDACYSIQGIEGMEFTFSDSLAKVWDRTDTNPIALGSSTKCGLIWDGQTPFIFTADKILGIKECDIRLNYDISVVMCECQ